MIQQSTMNSIWNVGNSNQGPDKRVVAVCSAGLLRSPTVAGILVKNGYNARSCGIHDYALINLSDALIHWADIIIFVEKNLTYGLDLPKDKQVVILNIPDKFQYNNPELVKIITEQLTDEGIL